MRIGQFEFKPNLWMTVGALGVVSLFIRLGFWQIHRGDQKQDIVTRAEAQQHLPPLVMKNGVAVDIQTTQYRTVSIQGKYAPDYTIYLDNKTYQGRPGYQVIVPLQLSGSNAYVLVNRGWIEGGATRAQLPAVLTPSNEVTVEGMLQIPQSNLAKFGGGNRSNKGWPALYRWVDVLALAAETGLPLKPYVILEQSRDESSLVHDWHLVSDTPDKNYAYAAQWFTFAGIVILLWVKLNLKRSKSE